MEIGVTHGPRPIKVSRSMNSLYSLSSSVHPSTTHYILGGSIGASGPLC